MSDFLEQFRNPGTNTFNGAKAMSAMTGGRISTAEITWMFNRLSHLMHVEGLDRKAASAKVKEESKDKPWEKA